MWNTFTFTLISSQLHNFIFCVYCVLPLVLKNWNRRQLFGTQDCFLFDKKDIHS